MFLMSFVLDCVVFFVLGYVIVLALGLVSLALGYIDRWSVEILVTVKE
jgi:hypothetical protein